MIETKKSLRIAAGIILLVLAVYGLGSNIAAYFMGHLQGRVSFFTTYWNVLLTAALVVLTAVFILTRNYVGAGVVSCVRTALLLYSFIISVVSLASARMSSVPKLYLVLTMLSSLLSLAGVALLIPGFFKHNRSAKPFFLIAGCLILASSLISGIQPTVLPILDGFGPTAERVGFFVGGIIGALLAVSVSLLPWIFLAIFFGAQQLNSAETTAPAWSYDAPQQWSDPAPQQSRPTPQQQNYSGGWKPYP